MRPATVLLRWWHGGPTVVLRCGSRNSLALRHLQGRYSCDLPWYSYGGGMEGLWGGSHVDCVTYWFCCTYNVNSTAFRHRSRSGKKTWRVIYPHFKGFCNSPSRSDDLTVAVRLQPTGTSCSRTGASRHRRLTTQHSAVATRRLASLDVEPGAKATRLPSLYRYAVVAPPARGGSQSCARPPAEPKNSLASPPAPGVNTGL